MKSSVQKKRACEPLKWQGAMKLLALMREDMEEKKNIYLAKARLLLAIGFYTGLRISDILHLTWLTISEDYWQIKAKKTGKIQQVEVNPKLRKIIKQTIQYIDLDDYSNFIFIGLRGKSTGKPIAVWSANHMIKKIFDRYDIQTANPSSHTLRKTFGRRVYEHNGRTEDALILLSKMFSHRSIQETREYIGLTSERIRSMYNNI